MSESVFYSFKRGVDESHITLPVDFKIGHDPDSRTIRHNKSPGTRCVIGYALEQNLNVAETLVLFFEYYSYVRSHPQAQNYGNVRLLMRYPGDTPISTLVIVPHRILIPRKDIDEIFMERVIDELSYSSCIVPVIDVLQKGRGDFLSPVLISRVRAIQRRYEEQMAKEVQEKV